MSKQNKRFLIKLAIIFGIYFVYAILCDTYIVSFRFSQIFPASNGLQNARTDFLCVIAIAAILVNLIWWIVEKIAKKSKKK